MSKTLAPAQPKEKTPAAAAPAQHKESWRDTVESVVVAFVLAFLIRAFEAEAFVIPTGSMAPTLQGMHKDFTCVQCGFWSRVGNPEKDKLPDPKLPMHSICPNCRFPNDITKAPWSSGDRILVEKVSYAFSTPRRWDVAVFRYPVEPHQNYIKRLVGVGPEELRIHGGDLYRRKGPNTPWRIVRKPPEKQQVLRMRVYDNDLPAKSLPPEWQRWAPAQPETWAASDDGTAFQLSATEPPAWLRYRHLVPIPSDWKARAANVKPRLVDDFYAYNAHSLGNDWLSERDAVGQHWVGDLTLDFEVEISQPAGQLLCELVEGLSRFRSEFDLVTGQVTLWQEIWNEGGTDLLDRKQLAQSATVLNRPGRHHVEFANVDDRILLWIDGSLVSLSKDGEGVDYAPPLLERLALRLAEHRPKVQPIIIYYDSAETKPAAERLEGLLKRLGIQAHPTIPFRADVRPDHLLEGRRPDTPIVLLGTEDEVHEILTSLDTLRGSQQNRYYVVGSDGAEAAERELPNRERELPNRRRHSGQFTVIHPAPATGDLSPAGIAAAGANVQVRHVKLDRDVYYVANSKEHGGPSDTHHHSFPDISEHPEIWRDAFDHLQHATFTLSEDQFLMLGDNSPKSQDSRLWPGDAAVDRRMLIGCAYFIYWPHGNAVFGWQVVPALGRMKFIR